MRTLISLAIVLFCLQLWAQVPDTTSVAPGRLILKVNQAFQTINTRSDGLIGFRFKIDCVDELI